MNTPRTLILILLLLCGKTAHAQYADHRNHKVDSLEQVLATNPPTGDALLRIYDGLAWGYLQTDKERSINYARKCIEMAIPLDAWATVANSYKVLGRHEYGSTQYDSAMVYYNKALEAIERMRDFPEKYTEFTIDDRLSSTYGEMGNLYNMQGMLHEAVDYYIRALRLFEKYGWKESQSVVYHNLGEMYQAMGNYRQAEINYLKADSIARETNDSLFIALINGGLSLIELERKEYKQAENYAKVAHDYYLAHPEEGTSHASILNTLSQIHLEGYNDMAQAETYVRQALELAKTNEVMTVTQAASLSLLANIYLRRSEWRKAEQAALESLALDDKEFTNTLPCYEVLAKVYAHTGDAARSGEYFDKAVAIQSSYSTKHYQSAIRDMEVKYETEKKETRIANLEDERRLMMWLGIAGGAVLLLALAALFLLWRWAVQKKRLAENQKELAEQQIKQLEQEKQLIATQAMLDGEVQERTRLARDLHDRMGGLLSALKYHLADIKKSIAPESASLGSCNKAIELLDESMHEMRRVAHHLMPDSLTRLGLKMALSEFCKSVPYTRFAWYGGDERLDAKMELVVYRIAYELVNNAMKHSGASHILLQIVHDPDRISITVEDNGCGFDTRETAEGMGLSNIRTHVASYNGIMDIGSAKGEGTEINVELRIEN